MARTANRRLTYEDLLALPDDGLRHELIDGEHYVAPAPNTKHQAVSDGSYIRRHRPVPSAPTDPGTVFLRARYDVVFSPTDVVEPDLLFVSQRAAWTSRPSATSRARPTWWSRSSPPSTRKLRPRGVKRRALRPHGRARVLAGRPGVARPSKSYRRIAERLAPRRGALSRRLRERPHHASPLPRLSIPR